MEYSIFEKVKEILRPNLLPNQFPFQPVFTNITAKNIKQTKSKLRVCLKVN